MYAERHSIAVTTNGSGAATVYSPVVTGRIITVAYLKTDFADGVDFTITLEGTGEGIWTESNVNVAKVVAPRQPTHNQVGVAALFAAAGQAVNDYIVAAKDRVKIVIAAGGDTTTGTFVVVVG